MGARNFAHNQPASMPGEQLELKTVEIYEESEIDSYGGFKEAGYGAKRGS